MMRRTKGETRAQQAERIRQAHEWMDDRRAGTVRLDAGQYREWHEALASYWTPATDYRLAADHGQALDGSYAILRGMARTR